MVKAKLTNGDLIFGLSDENIKRLKAGQPIKANLKDFGLEDRSVYIVHGETEDKIFEGMLEFIELGKTKIHI